MWTFLAQQWSTIATGTQDNWQDQADRLNIAPYHAYCKAGGSAWQSFLGPSQTTPRVSFGVASGIGIWGSETGVTQITLNLSTDEVGFADWGFLIFSSTSTGFTPAVDNLIGVVATNGANVVKFIHTDLTPDTYYYRAKIFAKWGTLGALSPEQNEIST